MAIFTAYSDVSGHPDDTDVLAVAGFVAKPQMEEGFKQMFAHLGAVDLSAWRNE